MKLVLAHGRLKKFFLVVIAQKSAQDLWTLVIWRGKDGVTSVLGC